MRKFASIMVLFGFTLLALAGCGGDSGCSNLTGTASTGAASSCGTGTTTGTPATVAVSSTSTTVAANGTATITAVVTSSSGAAVSGATVTFSTTAGTLSASTGTTTSSGQATTTLTVSGVAAGTSITVTAKAGTVSGTTAVSVSNSPGPSNVASLTVSTTAATLPSDGSGSATITVLAKDANNNALSGVAVTLAASAGTLSGAGTTTAANGTITGSLSAAGVTAGTTITITATSGTVTGKVTVSVVATQQTITLLTSSPQMPSNNSKPATITAIVQGANNQLLPGVALTFEASSGAIAPVQTAAGAAASTQVPAGTTDANGVAQATLSTPGNETNRTITVTVMAGSTIQTVQVAVVGTTLAVSGPASIVQGANGSYSVSLTDSAGNGIGNQTVVLTSALGNTLTPASVTTGTTTGAASFVLAAANSGADTITATWQTNVIATQSVAISNQNFSITAPAANATITVSPSTAPVPVPVTVSWTASGAGQNGTVVLSTTRGTLSATSVAVSNGALTTPVTIYSPTAGPAIISATALNGSTTLATAQTTVEFVATTPSKVSVQGTPSTVAVQGQSTITATVTDASGNPVQGATVDFTLTDTTGGSLSAPNATTTPQGQATVTYTASTTSSTANGVSIAVQVANTSVSSATTLTVGGQTVFLSLGTGNTIIPLNSTQYELPYTVQAVDAAGNGVSNVKVVFSVQSVSYQTGQWVCPAGCTAWQQNITAPALHIPPPPVSNDPKYVPGIGGCSPTSVYELNGQIQTTVPNPVPSNYVLTAIPGSVVATDVGFATTTAGGTAAVNLIYPKDHALWVAVALTATATVQSTQNSTTSTFFLPILSTDISDPKIAPPGQLSPYGLSATCY
jgi:Bacterial Ig-like domain (group 1)